MTREQAGELLKEMIRAEVAVVHSVNSHRGLTKVAAKRELAAANAIFTALVGGDQKLSPEEWQRISE